MNSYIVRIYRQEKDRPRSLVGIVEEVGVDGRRAFTDLDELWKILNSDGTKNRLESRGKRRADPAVDFRSRSSKS